MNKKMGFTLLELLMVVVVVATLTIVAVPQYRRTIQRAQATEGLMNLRTIFEAATRYKSQYSKTPRNLQGLDVGFFDAIRVNDNSSAIGDFLYEFSADGITARRLSRNTYTGEGTYRFTIFYNNETYGGRGAMICQAYSKKYETICPAFNGETTDEVPAVDSIYILDKIEESENDDGNEDVPEIMG